jgi:hypothetical protein
LPFFSSAETRIAAAVRGVYFQALSIHIASDGDRMSNAGNILWHLVRGICSHFLIIAFELKSRRWPGSLSLVLAALMLPVIAYPFGKYDARNGDECRVQVNANYDDLEADMRAHGNLHGIDAMNQRGRAIDLKACAQMDRQAREATMSKAWQRLSKAIETIKASGTLSADERRVLAADHEAIATFPPAPYREAYLRLHAEFMRYDAVAPTSPAAAPTRVFRCTDADGRVEFSEGRCAAGVAQTEMTVQPQRTEAPASWAQCREFKARIDSSRKDHDAAVAALLEARAVDGDGGWRALEARRIAALSEMNLQNFRARAAGCTLD